jgi:hypothetical protein
VSAGAAEDHHAGELAGKSHDDRLLGSVALAGAFDAPPTVGLFSEPPSMSVLMLVRPRGFGFTVFTCDQEDKDCRASVTRPLVLYGHLTDPLITRRCAGPAAEGSRAALARQPGASRGGRRRPRRATRDAEPGEPVHSPVVHEQLFAVYGFARRHDQFTCLR